MELFNPVFKIENIEIIYLDVVIYINDSDAIEECAYRVFSLLSNWKLGVLHRSDIISLMCNGDMVYKMTVDFSVNGKNFMDDGFNGIIKPGRITVKYEV